MIYYIIYNQIIKNKRVVYNNKKIFKFMKNLKKILNNM